MGPLGDGIQMASDGYSLLDQLLNMLPSGILT